MTEQRRQLDLQVSLLLDQKVSKLIEMMDEEHRDPQVEAMKKVTDPNQALSTLDRLLKHEDEEAEE